MTGAGFFAVGVGAALFLGGLTTFSSFSAEATELLMRAQYGWAALMISSHLIGSIALTFLGIFTVRVLAG